LIILGTEIPVIAGQGIGGMETSAIQTEIPRAWIAIVTLDRRGDAVSVDTRALGAWIRGGIAGFGLAHTSSRSAFIIVCTGIPIITIDGVGRMETKAAHAEIAGADVAIITIEGGVSAGIVGAAVDGAGIVILAVFGRAHALGVYA